VRRFGFVLYFSVILFIAATAYRHPAPTFDRYLYAATIASKHASDPAQIGQEALRIAPRGSYPHTAFTDELMTHPELMAQQIPFYTVKPGYILVLSTLGLRLVSPLAFVALAAILLVWLKNPWWCFGLILIPDVAMASRQITPDLLSAAIVIAAFYLLMRRTGATESAGLLLLLASVTVRADNLLYLLAAALFIRRMPKWKTGAFVLAGVLIFLAVNHYGHSYGWTMLVRHTLRGGYPDVAHITPEPIRAGEYIRRLTHEILDGAIGIWFAFFAALGSYAWRKRAETHGLLIVAAFFAVAHLTLFPIAEARYFLASYLLVGVSMASTDGITLGRNHSTRVITQ